MAIDTVKFVEDNLPAFKERMRITSGDEDERLKRMLTSSIVATTSLVGATELDEMLTELTFERARYVYHDALDEFQKNYADEIELQTFLNSLKEG
jgi:hypothetical protein|nr:MAG TPA: Head Tail Connector Protein [Caudoviricetes sp.]